MMKIPDRPLNLPANRLSYVVGADDAGNDGDQIARPYFAVGAAIALKCILAHTHYLPAISPLPRRASKLWTCT